MANDNDRSINFDNLLILERMAADAKNAFDRLHTHVRQTVDMERADRMKSLLDAAEAARESAREIESGPTVSARREPGRSTAADFFPLRKLTPREAELIGKRAGADIDPEGIHYALRQRVVESVFKHLGPYPLPFDDLTELSKATSSPTTDENRSVRQRLCDDGYIFAVGGTTPTSFILNPVAVDLLALHGIGPLAAGRRSTR
jgi:hypothetical protein